MEESAEASVDRRYILGDDCRDETLKESCQRRIVDLRRDLKCLRDMRDKALAVAVERGHAVEALEARLTAVEAEYAAAFPSEAE